MIYLWWEQSTDLYTHHHIFSCYFSCSWFMLLWSIVNLKKILTLEKTLRIVPGSTKYIFSMRTLWLIESTQYSYHKMRAAYEDLRLKLRPWKFPVFTFLCISSFSVEQYGKDIIRYSLVTILKTEYLCHPTTFQIHMLEFNTQCM